MEIEDECEKEIGFDENANFTVKSDEHERGVFRMKHLWE